jgi:hypothetical protein
VHLAKKMKGLRRELVEKKEETQNGNPLIGVRTGARHADGRLGGLGSEHWCLRESTFSILLARICSGSRNFSI